MRPKLAAGAALVACGLVLGVAGVWAAGSLAQAEITACIDANGYFFRAAGGRPCPGESLTWNQQGPMGPQGPAGQQGAQGPPGSGANVKLSVVQAKVFPVDKAMQDGLGYTRYRRWMAFCPLGYLAVGPVFNFPATDLWKLRIVKSMPTTGGKGWQLWVVHDTPKNTAPSEKLSPGLSVMCVKLAK